MVGNVKPRLSLGEKLKLAGVTLFVAPGVLAATAARFIFFALRNKLDVQSYILVAGVRVLFGTFTGRETQTLLPPTEDVYKAWVQRKKKLTKDPALKERLQCNVQPLADGNSSILWVGDRQKARKVVLFFHGGGYVMPAQAGHFESMWNTFVLSGVESDTEVAVAFLQYSLSPDAKAPVQLCQAASALSEILKAGFSAKDIVVGGDSAGGNLTMQILHHIIDPHPEACRIALDEPLSAAVLVSPWLTSDVSGSSFQEHGSNDMVSVSIMRFLGASASDDGGQKSSDDVGSWAEPLECKGAWMSKLDSVVKQIHITVGGREALADQSEVFVKTMDAMKTGVQVTLESDPKAAHDFIIAEGILEQIGEATIRMKEWFKGLL
ncbi:alpha/beta hydrolase fold domain-containing protein [Trichoderma chlorosporum]